jgi:uncharacterized membrane protein (UPF0136 family)
MTTAKWAMLVYGLAMVGMGIDGYVRAGSPMSLYGGGGMGAIVLLALWMTMKMSTPRWGYILALLVALGALGMFLPKLLRGDADAYPGGATVVLSILLMLFLIGGHFAARPAVDVKG